MNAHLDLAFFLGALAFSGTRPTTLELAIDMEDNHSFLT